MTSNDQHLPPPEPTLDHASAEQALLIAARLQQEQKERMSVSEVRRAAAEVGIHPEFVDRAISQMRQTPAPTRLANSQPMWAAKLANVGVVCTAAALQYLIAWGLLARPTFKLCLFAIVVIPALCGYFMPRSRRWSYVLVVGSLVGSLLNLCVSWSRFGWPGARKDAVVGMLLLMAIEAAAFAIAQWLSDLTLRSVGERVDRRLQ